MNRLLSVNIQNLTTSDKVFKNLCLISVAIILLVICGIMSALFYYSSPALKQFGVSFLFSRSWNPGAMQFGALTSIYGTITTTVIASVIAFPLSIMAALYITEKTNPLLSRLLGNVISLLSAIPSVIYGVWGLFVLVPVMSNTIQPLLKRLLGCLPFFQGPNNGMGILTAGIILAIMIIPFTIRSLIRLLNKIPVNIKEASSALGATRWETIRNVVLPYCSHGILGACLLGISKALGEAVAVVFVISNKHILSLSLFSNGNTIGSVLVNEFMEAPETMYRSALIELGLILFIFTVGIHIIARLLLKTTNTVSGVE